MVVKHAAQAIVLDADQVLLQKREDFKIWEFPGGLVDVSETFAQAAVRETREETGLIVEVVRHVADVEQQQMGNCLHLYECHAVGGKLIKESNETVDAGWFDVHQLPERCSPLTEKYLTITLAHYPEAIQESVRYPLLGVIAYKLAISIRNFRNRRHRG